METGCAVLGTLGLAASTLGRMAPVGAPARGIDDGFDRGVPSFGAAEF
jgi:hypothetical protein